VLQFIFHVTSFILEDWSLKEENELLNYLDVVCSWLEYGRGSYEFLVKMISIWGFSLLFLLSLSASLGESGNSTGRLLILLNSFDTPNTGCYDPSEVHLNAVSIWSIVSYFIHFHFLKIILFVTLSRTSSATVGFPSNLTPWLPQTDTFWKFIGSRHRGDLLCLLSMECSNPLVIFWWIVVGNHLV